MSDTENDPSRRKFLIEFSSGAVIAVTLPSSFLKSAFSNAPADKSNYLFFTTDEALNVIAAIDTLIPKDEVGPSASELGVHTFIDRQLAGSFGEGARLYQSGPMKKGTPTQGLQITMVPALLYRMCLTEIDNLSLADNQLKFLELNEEQRKKLLSKLETDVSVQLGEIPGKLFFELLYQNTMEGFFADPIYGGNKEKKSWEMLGFPGVVANYTKEIEEYRNVLYKATPKSIGDTS